MEELERQLSARGLSIAYVPEKGRCLVAAKDFSPGEVIISQEPYASMPNTSSSDQRCSRCFASGNLKKCSACRMVWYCGSECQKLDWKLHRLECQALVELGEDRQKMLTPSICLMVRLILKRKLQSEQAIPATAMDNYNLVEALTDHMSDIGEERLLLYAQMANLVNLILPSLKINIKEVARNFSKLACNAHTICDCELRPLGTGLYPVISIINHSCLPNSVLLFEDKLAVVRAVECITKGTELSISYIETAASTTTRQKALKEQYLFSCTCSRCTKEDQYEDIQEGAILEGYRCKDITCDGFLLLDSDKKVFLCQRCGLSRTRNEIKSIAKEIEQISEKASRSLSSGNLSEACAMYKIIEQLQLQLFHPLSINLTRTQETLLKIFMERQDWKGALVYCRLTLPVYEGVYPPIHPVVGLQYYTCGKLEWLLEETGEAIKSLTKAADILQITHGTSSPFVKELFAKLEEAHAEAAYSLKQHD